MEDASAVDLDWFWRGWFYTSDHCDVAMTGVKEFKVNFNTPSEGASKKSVSKSISKQAKAGQFDPILQSIANSKDPAKAYELVKNAITDTRKDKLNEDNYFYQVDLKMIGGLVMPVIFGLEYEDGTNEEIRIPAEIWKMHNWSGVYDPAYKRKGKKRTCGRPFSPDLTVRAGGINGTKLSVAPCCQTLGRDAEADLGSINGKTIEEVWNGERYTWLRQMHAEERFNENASKP